MEAYVKLHKFLCTQRGYNVQKLQNIANQIYKASREEFLGYKTKETNGMSTQFSERSCNSVASKGI